MDGSPQLLTDVKFTQLKRGGYDPDQVDNFLERVSTAVAQLQDKLRQATERAESADVQIAEARRLQGEAEAAAEQARAELAAGGGASVGGGAAGADDELKKVLVLAQRAADQAVEEANTTATRTVADARAKAVNLLAEAEQERDRMLAKARKKADAAAEERAHELHEQVTQLEAARIDLEADVDALQVHLDGERDRLREALESVQRVVDDPRKFRLAEPPELRNPVIPETEAAPDDDQPWATRPGGVRDGGPSSDPEAEPVTDQADNGTADLVNPSTSAGWSAPTAEDDESEAPAPPSALAAGGPSVVASVPTSADAPPPPDEHEGDDTIDLTNQRLFGSEETGIDEGDLGDGGPPTELFSAPSETAPKPPSKADPSPLGEPDAAADAAMRAFFEQDLDESTDASRSRFGRRR